MLVHAFNANGRLERLFANFLAQSQIDTVKKAIVHALQVGFLYLSRRIQMPSLSGRERG